MEDREIFKNLYAALEAYGEEVRQLYQLRLISEDKRATGNLINTVESFVVSNGEEFIVTFRLQDYFKYVEEGISPAGKYGNPSWKAYPFILNWIRVKPVLPRPLSNGKLPTEKQMAYLITRKIVNEGIDPGFQLRDSIDSINSYYLPIFQEALEKDFDSYASYVFGKINRIIKNI